MLMIFEEISNCYLWATWLSKKVTFQQCATVEIKTIFFYKLCNAEVLMTCEKINSIFKASVIGPDFLKMENFVDNIP